MTDDRRRVRELLSDPHAAGPTEPHIPVFSAAPVEPLPIARLGRYRLERLIGQGGMAEVYLAHAEGAGGFEKRVVVKRIKPVHHANKHFVEMFLREARVLATLDHPNVVKIFELDQEGAEYFVAMEYLEGITLRDLADRNWQRNKPLPIEIIMRAVADAALGLDHAHKALDHAGKPAHIVHRDVSPDNLFLSTFGVTKVLDFGIAKREGIDQLTQAGEIKGKIPYMSPEQLTAQPLDGRTDLWSLGVCTYWLLAGQRPFDAATEMMTMRNIVEHPPPSLRAVNPAVPAALEDVVMWTLQKQKSARAPTGAALHDALVSLLAGLPVSPVSVPKLVEATLQWPQPEFEVYPAVAATTTVPWQTGDAALASAPTRLTVKSGEVEQAVAQAALAASSGSAAQSSKPAPAPLASPAPRVTAVARPPKPPTARPPPQEDGDDLAPTIRLIDDDVQSALADARAQARSPKAITERVARPAPVAPNAKPPAAREAAGPPLVTIMLVLAIVTLLAGATLALWTGRAQTNDAPSSPAPVSPAPVSPRP